MDCSWRILVGESALFCVTGYHANVWDYRLLYNFCMFYNFYSTSFLSNDYTYDGLA